MSRNRMRRVHPLLCVVVALLACGDATPPENGGAYVATLTAPAGHSNGAAVIELPANGIESVTAVTGQLFTERTEQVVRVVIVTETPGELRFAVRLAQGSKPPRASVIEVADGNDQLRTSLAGYAVSFGR